MEGRKTAEPQRAQRLRRGKISNRWRMHVKLSREFVSVNSSHLVSIRIKLSHEVVNRSLARGVAPKEKPRVISSKSILAVKRRSYTQHFMVYSPLYG